MGIRQGRFDRFLTRDNEKPARLHCRLANICAAKAQSNSSKPSSSVLMMTFVIHNDPVMTRSEHHSNSNQETTMWDGRKQSVASLRSVGRLLDSSDIPSHPDCILTHHLSVRPSIRERGGGGSGGGTSRCRSREVIRVLYDTKPDFTL